MKTVTFQQIQDQAAEMAGRPKEKLPTSEQAILLMLMDTELKVMWNCQAWPELCDNLSALPVVNTGGLLTIDKAEGTANEIGDVLAIMTGDPRNIGTGCRPCPVEFEIGNGQIRILSPATTLSQLWVDYQLPPTGLLAVSLAPGVALPVLGYAAGGNTLANLLLPARFYQPLAMMAAAELLAIDGLVTQASVFRGLAQQNLDWQSAQPEMKAPWWRGIKLKR